MEEGHRIVADERGEPPFSFSYMLCRLMALVPFPDSKNCFSKIYAGTLPGLVFPFDEVLL